MKAVLISIQPKWCELIASGKKTVEVRKTRPKLKTPFKVYIYCCKPKQILRYVWGKEDYRGIFPDEELDDKKVFCKIPDGSSPFCSTLYAGKVIGEFVCNSIEEFRAEFTDLKYFDSQNENVCQNTIKRAAWLEDEDEPYYFYETSNEEDNPNDCALLRHSCLTFDELRQYIGESFFDKSFYGWNVSNLVIYDRPKKLSEFNSASNYARELRTKFFGKDPCCVNDYRLSRPPQSWCYVEELR